MMVPFNLKFYYDIDLPQNCQFTAQRKHICQNRNKVYHIFGSPLLNENVTTGLSMEATLQNKTFSVTRWREFLASGLSLLSCWCLSFPVPRAKWTPCENIYLQHQLVSNLPTWKVWGGGFAVVFTLREGFLALIIRMNTFFCVWILARHL